MIVWLNDTTAGSVVGHKDDVYEIEIPDHEVHEFVHKGCLINRGEDYRLLTDEDYLHQHINITNEVGERVASGFIAEVEGWHLIVKVQDEDIIAIDRRSVFYVGAYPEGAFQTTSEWMDYVPPRESKE